MKEWFPSASLSIEAIWLLRAILSMRIRTPSSFYHREKCLIWCKKHNNKFLLVSVSPIVLVPQGKLSYAAKGMHRNQW